MENDNNILNKFGNKKPFSVPENYFENFAVEMEKQVAQKKEKTATVVPFVAKLKPFLYAAAMFASVLLVGNYLTKEKLGSEVAMEQNELLLSYLDENAIIEFLIEYDN